MYINRIMCPYKVNSENKCKQIFRPWDCVNSTSDNSQDSTISTTTNETVSETKEDTSDQKIPNNLVKEGFRPLSKNPSPVKSVECSPAVQIENPHHQYYIDPYSSIYPDVFPNNVVQTLGVTPSDPLLLESMAQGYALEEYARVLNQEHQAKLMASKKQRPKKYKCPHCEVGFSNNGQLKGHIRIHTGERPFKCEEKDCGKTFTRNEELTRHKRIHSGLRPFPCTHCGKRFGRKDHLKKHSRTHFQPRGLYAVPVMLPFDTWLSASNAYPFIPMIS